jgi:hypothetical protein
VDPFQNYTGAGGGDLVQGKAGMAENGVGLGFVAADDLLDVGNVVIEGKF